MARLSHSSVSKFLTCPKSWDLHYNHKVRDPKLYSSLAFGSAIDNALNILLKSGSLELAKSAFIEAWTRQEVMGEYGKKSLKDISRSTDIEYSQSDYDADLLDEADRAETYTDIAKRIKAEEPVDHAERLVYQYSNWLSLKAKGLILLDAYVEQVLPHIKEIHGIQKECKITAPNGDSILMFVDLVCTWEDEYGKRLLVADHKTASAPYAIDAVKTSAQLALYTRTIKAEMGHDDVYSGYIVLPKKIKKNKKKVCTKCKFDGSEGRHKACPNVGEDLKRCNGEWQESATFSVDIQKLVHKISDHEIGLVLETYDAVNQAISNNFFVRNFVACEGQYGRCCYFDLCHKGSSEGLIQLK